MVRLREWILSQGGAAKANVFARVALAIFGQIPWRGVPFIPPEIMLFPKWFPFHLDKVSYWSRTVMVPLFILCTLKATAKNPNKVDVLELFVTHPDKERHYFPERTLLNKVFLALDKLGRIAEPLIPAKIHQHAIEKARDWTIERLNGEDGLGCIFPAMVNAYESLLLLGFPKDHDYVVTARKAIDKLLVINENDAFCQPCVSPVWDTGLTALALQEVDKKGNAKSLTKAYDWLKSVQLSDEPVTGAFLSRTWQVAAGLSNMPIRTIPMLTIRLLWLSRWPIQTCLTWMNPSIGQHIGLKACSLKMAVMAHSMSIILTII